MLRNMTTAESLPFFFFFFWRNKNKYVGMMLVTKESKMGENYMKRNIFIKQRTGVSDVQRESASSLNEHLQR